MAPVSFQKIAFVLLVTYQVIAAAPIHRRLAIGSDEDAFPAANLFGDQRTEHPLAKRDTSEADQSFPSRLRQGSMAALQETGKIVHTAAMLPAETLQLVRLLTVPVLDAALSLPANALESAASMSSRTLEGAKATARSSTEGILSFLAKVKAFKHSLLPHIGITKDFSLGPLSFHKTIEFGTPKKEITPPPPAEVYTTPCPTIKVPVTEAPKVEVTTPEPLPAPTTAAPSVEPPAPLPVVTPSPVAPVPAVVAPVVPVPAVVAPVAPVPAVVAPVAPAPAVVVAPPTITDGDQVQVATVVKH